jgi:hypothetical protein
MFRFWRNRRSKRGLPAPPAGRFQCKPCLEALEDRLVLSAAGTAAVGPPAPPMDHVAAVAITAIAGAPFSGVVATVNSPSFTGLAATIAWGDGHDGTGTFTSSGNQAFQISGAHTFAQPGSYTMVISISGGQGAPTKVEATTTVLAPPTNVMPAAVAFDMVSVKISFYADVVTTGSATSSVFLVATPAVANTLAGNSQLLVWLGVDAHTPAGNTSPPIQIVRIQIPGVVPADYTEYVPWSSMREQGLDLPLAESASPVSLIVHVTAGHSPQGGSGDLVVARAANTGSQTQVVQVSVPTWPRPAALALVLVFGIQEAPDATRLTLHEPSRALAAASDSADDTGTGQAAQLQKTESDSYRLPLHLVADRAELGVSLIAPLPGGSVNYLVDAEENTAREEHKPHSGRWSITVGAVLQAATVWVAIHFTHFVRANSPIVPSIIKEVLHKREQNL